MHLAWGSEGCAGGISRTRANAREAELSWTLSGGATIPGQRAERIRESLRQGRGSNVSFRRRAFCSSVALRSHNVANLVLCVLLRCETSRKMCRQIRLARSMPSEFAAGDSTCLVSWRQCGRPRIHYGVRIPPTFRDAIDSILLQMRQCGTSALVRGAALTLQLRQESHIVFREKALRAGRI